MMQTIRDFLTIETDFELSFSLFIPWWLSLSGIVALGYVAVRAVL